MSRNRCFGSFCKQRCNSTRTRAWRRRGKQRPIRVRAKHRRQRVRHRSHRETAIFPVSISYSTQPNAQMSARRSTGLALRLLRRHVRRRPQKHSRLRRHLADRGRSGSVTKGRAVPPPSFSPGRNRESSPCHRRRDLHVGGLQVAMHDAALVRVFQPLSDLLGDRQALPRSESDRP